MQRPYPADGDRRRCAGCPRYIWWNFVSSRKERIVQASDAWLAQAMGEVPGDAKFISLPERRFSAG